jgi:predicted alpha/beta-hydrolase family hydrolase
VYPSHGTALHATFVLAHGAGAGQQSAFMIAFAQGLSDRGIDVLTFNFLYTEQQRRVPDRTDKLDGCYRAAVSAGDDADELDIRGIVALGYPLHPPGKPEQLRAAHLPHIRIPMLIVQGERDPFGTPDELRPVLATVPANVTLHVVENGDHSLARSRGADAMASTYAEIQDVVANWIRSSQTTEARSIRR